MPKQLFFMEKEDSRCATGLSLGLGLPSNLRRRQPKPPPPPLEPSLTLSLSEEIYGSTTTPKEARLSSPHSTISSFSTSNIKKEKLDVGGEETEVERGSSLRAREEEDEAAARKKLRLTKEQSALLEDRFKEHSTLNPKQKQTLAMQLNLRARQIEVWFQNRRARTKLKQTEVDCEVLRRCCETLTEENRRLQKELQELRAIKFSAPPPPLFMQLPAATLMVCPSCERIAGAGVGAANNKPDGKDISGSSFMKPTQHLFNPFAHSATC